MREKNTTMNNNRRRMSKIALKQRKR